MTSKQVMLVVGLLALACGCQPEGLEPLRSPYPSRRVWAIAPLRNDSGSADANGYSLSDHLAKHLETATNLDVLPLNRTLEAMERLGLTSVDSSEQAAKLLEVLGVDGLVVGTITFYDPYDPPKLGMAIELYVNPLVDQSDRLEGWSPRGAGPSLAGLQRLSWSSTESKPKPVEFRGRQPMSIVSAILDSSDPDVKMGLERYAFERGLVKDKESWHLYRINMDLYSDFVSYVMSWRLLHEETKRQSQPVAETTPP